MHDFLKDNYMVKLIGLTGDAPALDISGMHEEKGTGPDFIVEFKEQTTWKKDSQDEFSWSLFEKSQVSNFISISVRE